MMYVHVAIFKWKQGVKKQDVDAALSQVKQLESLVKGIDKILIGKNSSKHAQGFTHAVVVVGKTEKSIQAYRDHPLHAQVAEKIESMEIDGIGVDFEDVG